MIKPLPNWLDPNPWMHLSKSTDLSAIEAAIYSKNPTIRELALLLSPSAYNFLEPMAQQAKHITQRNFGKTISLYSPLYLSNYCNGGCAYCGIAADRRADRLVLDDSQLIKELSEISKLGIDEIVLLTGERMPEADVDYLEHAIQITSKKISSVNIEVFPMLEKEYQILANAGCTGVTLYQETYDQVIYEKMHRWGDKRDFFNRLYAPNRALQGGLRTVGLGALLGLSNPRFDMLCLFNHANYLLKNFWQAGVTISFPRIKPQLGEFRAKFPVDERMLAQFIFALRICLPTVPLLLSTRETEAIRDGLAGLGISKMSVASKTTVGGYSSSIEQSTEQFEISDNRDVSSFCNALRDKNLEPIFKNYDAMYRGPISYDKNFKCSSV
jgi:2-iminoacetate synthase